MTNVYLCGRCKYGLRNFLWYINWLGRTRIAHFSFPKAVHFQIKFFYIILRYKTKSVTKLGHIISHDKFQNDCLMAANIFFIFIIELLFSKLYDFLTNTEAHCRLHWTKYMCIKTQLAYIVRYT